MHGSERESRTDGDFRRQYETIRALLARNGTILRLMSDIEADLDYHDYSDNEISRIVMRLVDETQLMAQELNLLTRGRFDGLHDVVEQICVAVLQALEQVPEADEQLLACSLDHELARDSRVVGGKAAQIALLRRRLPNQVPQGFVVTSGAYRLFMAQSDLLDKIRVLLKDFDAVTDQHQVRARTESIRELMLSAPVPEAVAAAIAEQTRALRPGPAGWAVRSSAMSEDQTFSFAGQFDSKLGVAEPDLLTAYRQVLASRFSARAISYRLQCGLREGGTPMAVLFMPMIEPRAAGVIYTRNPQLPHEEQMVVAAVPGLADRLVRGEQPGDEVTLTREPHPRTMEPATLPAYLGEQELSELGRLAHETCADFGYDMDIEWALDQDGHFHLLQGRRLQLSAAEPESERGRRQAPPLLESGDTLFAGRAVGPVERVPARPAPELQCHGPVAVTAQGTPELAPILPHVAGLLIEHGGAVGHLPTLVREFGVPALFNVGQPLKLLRPGSIVSVDATRRKVFQGTRWPEVRERVLARITRGQTRRPSGPLHDLVLALHLTDPFASDFKVKSCRSIHDVTRFIHEMAVRSTFRLGDSQNRPWRQRTKLLVSPLPVKLRLVDLDDCVKSPGKKVEPQQVESTPFRALMRGIGDPEVTWEPRYLSDLQNMPTEFVEMVLGGGRGPRRRESANYAVVARDYLNLNARFAFHYAMVEARVEPSRESNQIHFRHRGGGANDLFRQRRARFLEGTLRRLHFSVDRKQDIVNAWMRNYPQADSELALEMIGRLMACSRQLDMLLTDDAMIDRLVEQFVDGRYASFG